MATAQTDGAAQPDYANLLTWMQTVVTHPDTAAAGARTPEAEAIISCADDIEQVILPNDRLTGIERMAIYARSYHARLQECLAEDHGALQHALGLAIKADDLREVGWSRFVSAYISEHPPSHYSLDEFGKHLAGFIRSSEHPLVARLQPREFFAELAGLERVMAESFHLPAPAPLTAADLEATAGNEMLDAVVRLCSGVSLHSFEFPVHEFLSAWDAGKQPDLPLEERQRVVVYRKEFRVWRATIDLEPYAVLRALARGRTVRRALEVGMRVAGEDAMQDPEQFVDKVFSWFRDWAEAGLIAAIE